MVKNPDSNGATLFVKGSYESMSKLLHFQDSHFDYESIISYNTSQALKSVIFASRKLTEKEALEFQKDYLVAKKSTIEQEAKLAHIARLMETHLELQAIVGLKNSLVRDAHTCVGMLRDMGVGVHILSGDIQEHCSMTVQSLGLKEKDDIELHMNFTDTETGRSQVKACLDCISDMITKDEEKMKPSITMKLESNDFRSGNHQYQTKALTNKRLLLAVSGECTEVISKDRYLSEHFRFILEFCKVVVGYKMSPSEKAFVVECFKELEKKTLAIGDGFNDVNMLQSADVGIQIFDANMGYQFGDLIVDNLLSIAVAMNKYCRSWNDNLNMVVNYLYSFSAIYITINVFYQIFVGCTGESILAAYFITITVFFAVVLSLIFVFLNDRYSVETRTSVPGLYCEKRYLTTQIVLNVILFRIVVSAHPGTSRYLRSCSRLGAAALLVHLQHALIDAAGVFLDDALDRARAGLALDDLQDHRLFLQPQSSLDRICCVDVGGDHRRGRRADLLGRTRAFLQSLLRGVLRLRHEHDAHPLSRLLRLDHQLRLLEHLAVSRVLPHR